MATLTVRNVPDGLAQQIKRMAQEHGRSMEQEVREILQEKLESRSVLLERMAARADRLPAVESDRVDGWIDEGRKRSRT